MEQKEEVASAVNEGQEPSRPTRPPAQGDLEDPLLPAEAAHDRDQAPAQNGQQKDTLLYICAVLSIVTAIGGLLCMVVNLISLLRSFDYRGFDYRVSVFVGVVRFFAVAFALVVIVAETEWVPILRFWKVLDYWVGRGLLQVFVASLTYVLARASGETRAEGLLHEVASWWLLLCGIVYIVAGLLCLGTLKRNRLHKSDWREQAQKDLEEVHRRREELEAQLHGHR
ncbi:hypothetical protein M758_1G112000 [Ceratodon purpureus]|jgi:hypothetical protein|uniref:Uncharacterized protein n=1 Tax=Ceratodon purpureus TaxID=3225 RepID=A0A8T0J4N8_CERPU|nr:hypothetical protein KC19_1G105100 [Ceratodon purpureus]KAG0629555.1 hypothetical protein M758_1G112000 [Ceratodon purpureus]